MSCSAICCFFTVVLILVIIAAFLDNTCCDVVVHSPTKFPTVAPSALTKHRLSQPYLKKPGGGIGVRRGVFRRTSVDDPPQSSATPTTMLPSLAKNTIVSDTTVLYVLGIVLSLLGFVVITAICCKTCVAAPVDVTPRTSGRSSSCVV